MLEHDRASRGASPETQAAVTIVRTLRQFGCAVAVFLLISCSRQGRSNSVRAEEPLSSTSTTSVVKGKTIYADRIGVDPNDATEALQRAIDSDAETVVIPYTGKPWIVRPLMLRSGLKLVMEPGVVLEAKPGAFRGVADSVLLCQLVRDVSIVGYGATIRMRRDDYKSWGYKKGEWRHGICLKGASNISIRGLRIERTGGDGIYIGPTWDKRRKGCTEILVADCILDQNYRQGISIVAAVDVRIENCLITGTAGTAPQAGVDLEPSHPMDKLSAILLRNCVAEGNAGSGFMANLSRLSSKSEPISVRIEHCLVRNSVQPGLRVILRKDQGARGWIEFVDCTVEGTHYAGAAIVWDTASPIQLRFDNCRWAEVGKRSGQPPLFFDLVTGARDGTNTAIEFKDAVVFDPQGRDVFHLVAADARSFENIRGVINVIGPRSQASERTRFPNLKINYETAAATP